MYVGLFISSNWIISKTAQRVHLCCGLLAIPEFGLVVAAKLALTAAGAAALRGEARTLVHLLLVPTIVGTATLFVAMLYFWFGFDKSHWAKRTCWFFLLFFVPAGPVLYYFIVYRRSPVLRETTSAVEKRVAVAN